MNTQQENAIGSINAYAQYISGFVRGSVDSELTKEKLGVIEYSCRQLEAACNDLSESIK